jgi:hypothetical protein
MFLLYLVAQSIDGWKYGFTIAKEARRLGDSYFEPGLSWPTFTT